MTKPEKKVKKLEEYRAEHLPVGFIEPMTDEVSKYSRSIEMYDTIPKYRYKRVQKKDRIGGKFLEPLERDFKFRGEDYHVVITPARIKDKDGEYRDYFPGQREEIVEDALRKLAVEGDGAYLDEYVSVVFTLYKLMAELRRVKHGYSLSEIKRALEICNKTHLEVSTADGETVLGAAMFETLGLQTKKNWQQKDKRTQCFVRFNTLVNKSVTSKTFRYLNYKKCMEYENYIARRIFKRMSHHFVQAHRQHPYNINFSTIISDFGLTRCSRLRDNLREVKKALDELTGKGTLLKYEEYIIREGRKMVDVKFNLIPDMSFVFEMKKFNALFRDRISS